jgi:hypothetical protein
MENLKKLQNRDDRLFTFFIWIQRNNFYINLVLDNYVQRFINHLMLDGKKLTAIKIFHLICLYIKKVTRIPSLFVLRKAIFSCFFSIDYKVVRIVINKKKNEFNLNSYFDLYTNNLQKIRRALKYFYCLVSTVSINYNFVFLKNLEEEEKLLHNDTEDNSNIKYEIEENTNEEVEVELEKINEEHNIKFKNIGKKKILNRVERLSSFYYISLAEKISMGILYIYFNYDIVESKFKNLYSFILLKRAKLKRIIKLRKRYIGIQSSKKDNIHNYIKHVDKELFFSRR